MKCKKCRFVTACVFIVFSSSFFFRVIPEAKAMKDFTVTTEPYINNQVAEFEFHVTLEKKIGAHERFYLHFPAGTTFSPPLPEDEKQLLKRRKEITEAIRYSIPNGYCPSCMGVTKIEFLENGQVLLIIGTPRSIDPEDEGSKNFSIVISKEAGITTPSKPGFYKYGLYDSREPNYIQSETVEIVSSNKNNAFCWLERPYVNETTSVKMEIPFCLPIVREVKLTLYPNENFNFGPYLKDFSETSENKDWVYSQIWFQEKPATCFTEELKIVNEDGSIVFHFEPGADDSVDDGISIYFHDSLEMKSLHEGTLQFTGQLEVVYTENNKEKQETFPLQWNENYIFTTNIH